MSSTHTRAGPPLRPVLILAALLGFMYVLRRFSAGLDPAGTGLESATAALGFLLLAAFLAGKVAEGIGLPRITGYLVLGLLVGPSLLHLLTDDDIGRLRLIDDIAISLIALSAGGELRMRDLRSRGRTLLGIMAAEMAAVFLVVGGAVVLLAPLLPFTQGQSLVVVLTIALVFGSIAIANSPSVSIAVINDTGSRGPVSSTILGVTVIKDVAVIVFFAVALGVARTVVTPDHGFETAFFMELAWEVGGSILLGAFSGWIISVHLRTLKSQFVLFALALAFLNAYIASVLHLEVLLLSLTAGFFVENISPVHGEPFVEAVETNSLPLYALFFALAGASIHLSELAELWPFAVGLVVLRAAAVFGGTWLGAHVTGAEPEVRRYAWLGFISQAGVTLGMVVIAARAFPEWGSELRTLFVAMVAIHELIGPVMLQTGLRRAGETGARGREAAGAAARVGPDAAAGAAPPDDPIAAGTDEPIRP